MHPNIFARRAFPCFHSRTIQREGGGAKKEKEKHVSTVLIIAWLINAEAVLISRTSSDEAEPFHKLLTEYATGTTIWFQIRLCREDATSIMLNDFEGCTHLLHSYILITLRQFHTSFNEYSLIFADRLLFAEYCIITISSFSFQRCTLVASF